MSTDLVHNPDVGDGTPDQVLAGVEQTVRELVGVANALGQVIEEILARLEEVEGGSAAAGADVDLDEWVGWIRRSYRLHALIPPAWADIAGVRQEVEALHAAWCAAYNQDGTPITGTAATAWHDALDRALQRMRTHSTRDEERTGVESPPWADEESAAGSL